MICRTWSSALFVLVCGSVIARAEPPNLNQLRQEFALKYLEPGPHMALAKYHHARGQRLLAFYILESARRTRFDQETFDTAFRRAFLDSEPFDNSKEAEALLLKQHRANPKATVVLIKLADVYISREEYAQAKNFLGKAIALAPEDFPNVMALSEVLRREGDAKAAAKLVEDFLAKYPLSAPAFKEKIGRAMSADPKKARTLLDEALKRYPNDGEFHFNLGVLLQNENNLKDAEAAFVKAAALAKDSAYVQGWVGRFFLKVRGDEEKALHYTLNAYFLDPHFRDSEYAEGRIRKLNFEAAHKSFAKSVSDGKALKDLIHDENPVVAGLVVARVVEKWEAGAIPILLEALDSDDPNVRWQATAGLMMKVDRKFDPELRQMLKNADARKRGMAAYLAVHLWGADGIVAVKPWLEEESQMLRFDAISALLEEGGAEGRAIVLAHKKREKHPWLLKLIASVEKN